MNLTLLLYSKLYYFVSLHNMRILSVSLYHHVCPNSTHSTVNKPLYILLYLPTPCLSNKAYTTIWVFYEY